MDGNSAKLLQKPILRHYSQYYTQKSLIIALVCAFSSAFVYKFTVAEPRKRKYIEFYKNWDDDAECERLFKLGYLKTFKDIEV